MCGIVGYVGKQEAHAVLIEGLRKLEYRGYDSAGIAVIDQGRMRTIRCEGKLQCLVDRVQPEPPSGHVGIGHTRWATHGRPSDINAHPHQCGAVAVVHNGIIENFQALRDQLLADGHQFESDTDTEIVAHLIYQAMQGGAQPRAAIQQTLEMIQGAYALCVSIEGFDDRVWVAKNESPLVIGLGDGESFAASDIPAILHHTRRMIYLEDGDVGELSADGVHLYDADGRAVERAEKVVAWSPVMAEKEGYKHFMLKEIHEQPRSVADTLRGRIVPGSSVVTLDDVELPEIQRIVMVACGTSYHATLVGKFWLESLAKVPVEVDLASEYRYRDPLVGEGDLVVAVTQSGETADTRAAALLAQERGAHLLAITNVVDSSIARAADSVLYTHAGPEIGVASTKAFTTQLIALQLLSMFIAQRRGAVSDAVIGEMAQQLAQLPHHMQTLLHRADEWEVIAHQYLEARDWLFLGRGTQYPIALEGALKLKEISYAHAEGYAAGEMKHGPIALIDEHVPVVGIAPQGAMYEKISNNLQQVKSRGGKLIALVTEGDSSLADYADHLFSIPQVPECIHPYMTVLPLQLLSYYVADGRGTDVDQPRNLAKSVTVE